MFKLHVLPVSAARGEVQKIIKQVFRFLWASLGLRVELGAEEGEAGVVDPLVSPVVGVI
jgi:hypothetical protein